MHFCTLRRVPTHVHQNLGLMVTPKDNLTIEKMRGILKMRLINNLTQIIANINEPPRGKTNNLHKRKQRRRSASP